MRYVQLLSILDKDHNTLLSQQTGCPTSHITSEADTSPRFPTRISGQRVAINTHNEPPTLSNPMGVDTSDQHIQHLNITGPSFKECFRNRAQPLRPPLYERRSMLTVGGVDDLTALAFRAGKRSAMRRIQDDAPTQSLSSSSSPSFDPGSGGTLACLRLMQIPQSLNPRYLFILVPLVFFLVMLIFYHNTRSQPMATEDSHVYFEGLS